MRQAFIESDYKPDARASDSASLQKTLAHAVGLVLR